MIWFKRLLPLAVIIITALAYYLWDRNRTIEKTAYEEELADITAQVWIGTATYRDDPQRYMTWRDSLLEAHGVEREELFAYLAKYEERPERLIPFATLIQRKVDSLGRIEDSLFREARIRARDSALTVTIENGGQ